ncbi:MAG: PEGA domain-containing protein [Dictyoglomus thermophilum]|uniref:PEGA domain-containing protein n=1 Tax=Dictyoglomus thermophilum TaxID=14 RepID=A0A7V3ZK60_DICTH|nr:PEGA domain-containing protein [Dictyoglomus thermophilum]MCX7720573.1 PEGA domain-containing protein [Dictyoglomus thermophilum]TYT24273.1 PEGA domain-containing protein [Dictyoglomus thermophilum]
MKRLFSLILLIFILMMLSVNFAQEKIQIQPEKDWEKIIIVPNPEPILKLDLWLNKPQGSVYKVGEDLIIYARANDDVYLYIFDITPDGQFKLIFPNSYSKDNFIKKDKVYTFPDKPTYKFKVTPPFGKEYIVGIITKKPIEIFPGKRFENLAPGSVIEKKVEVALDNIQKTLKREEGKTWAQSVTFFYVQEAQVRSSIKISSNPPGASVYLDNDYQGTTPITLMLLPGNYRITLKKEGYLDYSTNIVVQEGRDREYNFTLQPAYGNLRIETDPRGASVYLDGSYKGLTPLILYNIPAKTYQLRIVYPGYQERVETIRVEPNKTTYLSYSLIPLYGSLSINSIPQGAEVYLNGVYRGKTPLVINNINPGRYQIQLRLKGYKDYVGFVDVYSGQISTYNFTLVPLLATLNVFSTPSGADVYINGVYKGKTPLSVSDLSAGSYNVRVTLSGYEDYYETVYLESGDVKQLNVTLKPISSEINIDSQPRGARVYIDGKYQGTTPITLYLREGRYTLTLSLEGYNDLTTEIVVKPRDKASYMFTLVPIVVTKTYYLNFTKGGYDGNLIVVRAENVFMDKEGKEYALVIRPSGVFEVKVPSPFNFKDVILKINLFFERDEKKKSEIYPSLVILVNGKNITLPISFEDKDYVIAKWNIGDFFDPNKENVITIRVLSEAQNNVRVKEIVVEGR